MRRESACTASSLIVSSDYGTLLRNMGWHQEPDVLKNINLTNKQARKSRYGLMGPDPYTEDPHNGVGNVYYGVVETEKFNDPSTFGDQLDDWVTLSKNLAAEKDVVLKRLSKNIRIAVPTKRYIEGDKFEPMPGSKDDALASEIVMNIRAINDFISDTGEKEIKGPNGTEKKTIWSKEELDHANIDINKLKDALTTLKVTIEKSDDLSKVTGKITEIPQETINAIKSKGSNFNKIYEECLETIYSFLKIPRIHCPWEEGIGSQYIIYLGAIDVNNTDLKFKGEKSTPEAQPASDSYEVVLFSARHVARSAYDDDGNLIEVPTINFKEPCLLHSPFTVNPSVTIAVNASSTAPEGIACMGSIAEVTAELWVEEVDTEGNPTGTVKRFTEAYPNGTYTFDWYLGGLGSMSKNFLPNKKTFRSC